MRAHLAHNFDKKGARMPGGPDLPIRLLAPTQAHKSGLGPGIRWWSLSYCGLPPPQPAVPEPYQE